jgi:hypothetical protein
MAHARRRGHDDRAVDPAAAGSRGQWREQGAIRFLVRYLGAYLGGRRSGLDHGAAYSAIPAEVEARSIAGR